MRRCAKFVINFASHINRDDNEQKPKTYGLGGG